MNVAIHHGNDSMSSPALALRGKLRAQAWCKATPPPPPPSLFSSFSDCHHSPPQWAGEPSRKPSSRGERMVLSPDAPVAEADDGDSSALSLTPPTFLSVLTNCAYFPFGCQPRRGFYWIQRCLACALHVQGQGFLFLRQERHRQVRVQRVRSRRPNVVPFWGLLKWGSAQRFLFYSFYDGISSLYVATRLFGCQGWLA